MCEALAEGGKRCAADTRTAVESAQAAYDQALAARDDLLAAPEPQPPAGGMSDLLSAAQNPTPKPTKEQVRDQARSIADAQVKATRRLEEAWVAYASTPEGHAAASVKTDWPNSSVWPNSTHLTEQGQLAAHQAAVGKARANGSRRLSAHTIDKTPETGIDGTQIKARVAAHLNASGMKPYDPAPEREWRTALEAARHHVNSSSSLSEVERRRANFDLDMTEAAFIRNGARAGDVYEAYGTITAQRPEMTKNGQTWGERTTLTNCEVCGRFTPTSGDHACPGPASEARGQAAARAMDAHSRLAAAQAEYDQRAATIAPPEGSPDFPQGLGEWHVSDADDRYPGEFTARTRNIDGIPCRVTPGDLTSYANPGYAWTVGDSSGPSFSGVAASEADAAAEAEAAAWYLKSGQAEHDATYEPEDRPVPPETLATLEKSRQRLDAARIAAEEAQAGLNAAESRYWTSAQGSAEYGRMTKLFIDLGDAGRPEDAAKVADRIAAADQAMDMAAAHGGAVRCPACGQFVSAAHDHACPNINGEGIAGRDRRHSRVRGGRRPRQAGCRGRTRAGPPRRASGS
jgi:hypothetical protein